MRRFLQRHRIEAVFALSVFIVHGYFYGGQGWNQNARLDGIYAVVESGTFHIDAFVDVPGGQTNTGDWSKASGHYYPNKAPGTVLAGVPVYWLLYHLEAFSGMDPTAFELAHWNAYLINLWLSVFFGALAAGLFLKWLRQEFPDQPATTLAIAAVCFFGTLVFPFDSQIWGTTTASYFIIFAWVLAHLEGLGAGKHIAVGACLGTSLLFDYSAVIPLAFVCIYYALDADLRSQIPRLIAGGLPAAVVLLGYHKLIFGSFLTHAAASTNELFVDPERLGGFFGFDPRALRMLVFSKFRGVFYFMPVLVFVFPGAVFLYREGRRHAAVVCLASLTATLLFVSSFNGWHGGSATGPRYLISSLPFYFILLSGMAHASRRWKTGFFVVGALSGFQMFAIAAISSSISVFSRDPLVLVYGRLFSGRLEMRDLPVRSFTDLSSEQWSMTTFNLGYLLDPGGISSLAPLVLVALLFALWLRSLVRDPGIQT